MAFNNDFSLPEVCPKCGLNGSAIYIGPNGLTLGCYDCDYEYILKETVFSAPPTLIPTTLLKRNDVKLGEKIGAQIIADGDTINIEVDGYGNQYGNPPLIVLEHYGGELKLWVNGRTQSISLETAKSE